MSAGLRLGLTTALAVLVTGCDPPALAGAKQSVTVKLPPPRPYKPEPGFSLATDLPTRDNRPVQLISTSSR
jgi:hypothetical protein